MGQQTGKTRHWDSQQFDFKLLRSQKYFGIKSMIYLLPTRHYLPHLFFKLPLCLMCFQIPCKKSLTHVKMIFISRRCKELKNVQNIEIISALFELPAKGQKISEEFFLVFKYSKTPTKVFTSFCPSL